MKVNKHALVVGGTGMLRAVSLKLTRQGYAVSVIARDKAKLDLLQQEALPNKIVPISLNYNDLDLLEKELTNTIKINGTISLAVIWIHSEKSKALDLIANLVSNSKEKCNFYHILGSINLSELKNRKDEFINRFKELQNFQYHQITLGHIKDHTSFRWLTNKEIADGVLKAINTAEINFVVGDLH